MLSFRWAPRLLDPDSLPKRETISKQCLTLSKRNSKAFLRHSLAVYEHDSTGPHQRPRNSCNSVLHQEDVLQRSQRLSCCPEGGEEKMFSVMKMHQLPLPPGYRPNCSNWVLNFSPIHHTRQIRPVRLFGIANLKNSLARQTFESNDEVGHRHQRPLLYRPGENVFLRRVKEVGKTLRQVNRRKRRLYWIINCHFFWIFVFL